MNGDLKRRVEALRRPLELAAADNFAGVRKVQGLGHALRAACDGLIATLAPEQREPRPEAAVLTTWRAVLARWESLDEQQQSVEVARGMRLVARFPRTTRIAPVASRSAGPGAPATATLATAPATPAAPTLATAPATRPPQSSPPGSGASAPAERSRKRTTARGATPPAANATSSAASPVTIEDDPLAAATHSLPGIGPAFAERLAEKGLATVEDLLWMVPRRYDDVRDATSLGALDAMPEGARATFVARVASSRMVFARGRRWADVRLEARDPLEPATATVRWFNVFAGIDKRMPPGSIVTLSGVVKRRGGRLELANPDILGIELEGSEGATTAPAILARYPDVAGVPPARLRTACAAACARVGDTVDDGVPAEIERAAGIPSLGAALAALHAPSPALSADELAAMNRGDSRWQRRLAFGELFALGVAITLRRRERRADAAVPCPRAKELDAVLARALPFSLTAAQRRVIGELGADLARDVPMNRLLQGDVGSGKTCVAFAAALQVARAGRQVAVMAPTELLAEQHAETWRAWAATGGLRIELLTASTPKGVRHSLLSLLAAGQLDVVIGTHALLSEGVGFGALGLVVIDEQHRFGVAQRARLRDKGDGQGAPHLLVMTATPIPRTLALTAFGDLDASVLDELPPGRKPITTRVVSGVRGRTTAVRLIDERVAAGERAYVVCPKVEATEPTPGNDARAWTDATTTATELAAALPHRRIGLVHGRLDAVDRDRVMRAFKQGEIDVLVATTVIEVGVDVPQATVMVVHDAERFGLAQLHQLRGRVGRGGDAAHCVLLAQGTLGEDAKQRLDALVETQDGFRVAEYDLALRGPGELLGPQQAGVPRLRFGDLSQHIELLLEARRFAELWVDQDADLEAPRHGALKRAISRRYTRQAFGAEGG